MTVVVAALGTRGDVQPCAAVARALKRARPALAITFVTHHDHQVRSAPGPPPARQARSVRL